MNSGNLIVLGIIVVIVLLVGFVAYSGSPKRGDQRRGTAPGKGDTIRHFQIPSHGASEGTTRTFTMRHTKDPNKHAQAMMPAKARKKDQNK